MSNVTKKDINELSEGLSDLSKIMEGFTKRYENFSDKHHKNSKDTTSFLESTTKSLSKLGDTLDDILSYTGQIGKAFIGFNLVANLKDMVSETFKIESEMSKLAYRMGEGAAGADKLTKAVNNTRRELGASADEATQIVSSLASGKFIGDIESMTKATFSFSKATGIAESTASNFAVTLNKEAGMSATAAASVMAGMTKVQQKVGISANGMEALTSTIQSVAYNMSALGKSTQEVSKTSTELTSLVGALEKIGISAQKSTQLIDKLLDPDRIEENIGLYAQMGISISDAIAGNIDGDEIAGGMQQIAERIAAMGPIAGSQFGKQFGMSYKDAMKISSGNIEEEMSGIAEAAATPEEQALEALKAMNEQMDTTLDVFQKFENKLSAIFAKVGPAGIAGVAIFIAKLVSGVKDAFDKAKDFLDDFNDKLSSSVSTAIADSISMGFDKAKKISNSSSKEMADVVGNNFKKVTDFGNFGKKVLEETKKISNKLINGATSVSKQLEKEIRNFEKISNGLIANDEKKISSSELRYKRYVANRTNETVTALQELYSQQEELRNLDLEKNSKYLELLSKGEKEEADKFLSSLKDSRTEAVNDINDVINNLIERVHDVDFSVIAETIGGVTLEATEKIKNLTDSIKNMSEEMKNSVYFDIKGGATEFNPEKLFTDITNGLKKLQNDISQGADSKVIDDSITSINKNISKAVSIEKLQIDIINEKAKKLINEGKITEANALKAGEMAKHQSTLNFLQKDALKQVQEMKSEQEKIVENAKLLNQIKEREANNEGGKKNLGIKNEIGEFFKTALSPIADKFKSIAGGIKGGIGSAKEGLSSIKTGFKEKGAGAMLGAGAKKAAAVSIKGISGITKGIGKIVGMLGAAGVVMALLGPILEKAKERLEPFLTQVEELIDGFVDMLMPLVEELATAFSETLLPVIETLLSTLLPIVKTLFSALMPIVTTLLPMLANLVTSIVKVALPPILKILSWLIKPVSYIVSMLGYVVQGIGHIIKLFNKDKEDGIGAQIVRFGKQFTESTREMGDKLSDGFAKAAEDIKNGTTEGIVKGIEKSEEEKKNGPLTLNAHADGSITAEDSVVSSNKSDTVSNVSSTNNSSKTTAKADPIVRESVETTSAIMSRIFPKDDTNTFATLSEDIRNLKDAIKSIIASENGQSPAVRVTSQNVKYGQSIDVSMF